MVVSGTGKCLSWLYPGLLLVLAVQASTVLICFISAIKEPVQPLQAGFGASVVPYHNFEL